MLTVLGIRHHGPGSATAVAAALAELAPDAVLVEGPPELEPVLALAADPEMRPPVALLAYVVDDPRRAAFFPLASFSPEWVAIRYALAAGVPVRLIDLPAAHSLAPDFDSEETAPQRPHDPLGLLAEAAGNDDAEAWWEDVVEHRHGSLELFGEIADAMAQLREDVALDPRTACREAAMRRAIRRAEKDGCERIAVVCGAWHAPALAREAFGPAARDDALLRGLAKVKIAATWVPWTNERLSFASGYGAGVSSPGWYEHLFTAPNQLVARWLQRVAALLREEGLDASPASVVEAVRLSQSLAALRGRPVVGLNEAQDAALTVLCGGDELRLGLIHRRLVVGDTLGSVPEATPMVPLLRDLAAKQRSLRMAPAALSSERTLDLRKDLDLARSRLLHQLRLLGVGWGTLGQSAGTGTFRETWQLSWQPELAIALIDASRYGATVPAAAEAFLAERAVRAEELAELTGLLEVALLAGLGDGVGAVLSALADRAALAGDIGRLMDAVEPLARVQRYGSVRREDSGVVAAVLDGLITRICVGLPQAVSGLDDDAAAVLVNRIEALQRAVTLVNSPGQQSAWIAAQRSIAARTDVHGLVNGRITRLLLDGQNVEQQDVRRRMSRELSRAADAERAAAWVEGFLAGSGLLLLHDVELLSIIDDWITHVSTERFDDLLPVLRRTFSQFGAGERRQIGAAVRQIDRPQSPASGGSGEALDLDRADAALATVMELLG